MLLGANYFRWGQLEYLNCNLFFGTNYLELVWDIFYSSERVESTGSISGLYTAITRSISSFCAADTACTPSISGFDTAGTACTRGYVLLILPTLAVFGLSALLILPVVAVFRQSVRQYSQYSGYSTPSILGVSSILGASVQHCNIATDIPVCIERRVRHLGGPLTILHLCTQSRSPSDATYSYDLPGARYQVCGSGYRYLVFDTGTVLVPVPHCIPCTQCRQ